MVWHSENENVFGQILLLKILFVHKEGRKKEGLREEFTKDFYYFFGFLCFNSAPTIAKLCFVFCRIDFSLHARCLALLFQGNCRKPLKPLTEYQNKR